MTAAAASRPAPPWGMISAGRAATRELPDFIIGDDIRSRETAKT
jgi:hypothetical protein